jgi:hypothetical protein
MSPSMQVERFRDVGQRARMSRRQHPSSGAGPLGVLDGREHGVRHDGPGSIGRRDIDREPGMFGEVEHELTKQCVVMLAGGSGVEPRGLQVGVSEEFATVTTSTPARSQRVAAVWRSWWAVKCSIPARSPTWLRLRWSCRTESRPLRPSHRAWQPPAS